MRLVNDPKENSPAKEPANLALIPFYALFCAVGFSTFIFSTLPLILIHRRLPDFWPKVVGIAGAILALVLFEVPAPAVLTSFVLGLFVADGIQKQTPVWNLLLKSGILLIILGLIGTGIYSYLLSQSDPWALWTDFILKVIEQAKQNPVLKGDWDWNVTEQLLLYQGPFYFVSGNLLMVWFSIGLAAHLGWPLPTDLYSSQNLRKLKLPRFLGPGVLLFWGASQFLPLPAKYIANGISNWGLVFISFQGFLAVSTFLQGKNWPRGVRTAIYLGFIFIGFYALVGLGLISSNILTRKTQSVEETV